MVLEDAMANNLKSPPFPCESSAAGCFNSSEADQFSRERDQDPFQAQEGEYQNADCRVSDLDDAWM
jgi:hypothetical protein